MNTPKFLQSFKYCLCCYVMFQVFMVDLAVAENPWSNKCNVPNLFNYRYTSTDEISDSLEITAAELYQGRNANGQKFFKFNKDVKLNLNVAAIQAANLKYESASQEFNFTEEFGFNSYDFSTLGTSASGNFRQKQILMNEINFHIHSTSAVGYAQQASLNYADTNQSISLFNLSYTTCSDKSKGWHLDSDKIFIDHQAKRVYAYNSWLNIYDLPVAYTPYISYPTSDRGSGFLIPAFGLYSANDGENIKESSYQYFHYYFDIAPNYDYTLSFATLGSVNAYILDNNFRFLTKKTIGSIDYVLAKNPSFKANQFYYYELQGDTKLAEQVSLNWLIQTTNQDYFFAMTPYSINRNDDTTNIRRIGLNYKFDKLNASLLLQYYQPLLNSVEPKGKLPQIRVNYNSALVQHNYKSGLMSYALRPFFELTNFDYFARQEHSNTVGYRNHAQLNFYANWDNSWSYIRNQLSYWHTYYDVGVGSDFNNTQIHNNGAPILASKMGLRFEKKPATSNELYSTLEPGLQYVLINSEAQNDLPNFDSSELTLDYGNLLGINRFSGKDRIGDTNHVNLYIKSKWYDGNRNEKSYFNLAQRIYFEDRKVGLYDYNSKSENYTASASDLFATEKLTLGQHQFYFNQVFANTDYELKGMGLAWFLFRHKYSQYRIDYFGDNLNSDPNKAESIHSSFNIGHKGWSWTQHVRYNITLENLYKNYAIVSYENCCMKTSFSYLSDYQSTLKEDVSSIELSIELKALSRMGRNTQAIVNSYSRLKY